MASSPDSVSMALFCDFENVALGVRDANYDKFDIKRVLERLLLKGSIVVKKAYCDWDRYKSFKAAMHEANFELIEIPHVRQSGKNSADIRLVVDALDLCYTKSHVDTFVIISGDSDFSPLVSKLRENAKQVIGVGVKQSTSDLLIANCDEFIFYDDLVRDSQRAAAKREARDNPPPVSRRSPEEEKQRREEMEALRGKAIDIAVETFEALLAERGESGKIWSSMLKEAIKRRKPDFNESYFGFRAFGNLLEEAQSRGLLELGRDEKSGTYVTRPGPGMGLTEPYAAPREPRSVEVPEGGADTHAEGPSGIAAAEPAARGGRQAGRGARRRGGKAVETESLVVQAASVAEAAENAPRLEEAGHEVVQAESRGAERPEPSLAAEPADAAPKSRGGRGRGRGAAVKADAAPAPAAAVPVPPAPEPEAAQGGRSDEVSADRRGAKRGKRGSERSGREPAQSVGNTGVAETRLPESEVSETKEPGTSAAEIAAKVGRATKKARAAQATVASPPPPETVGSETGEVRNDEPAAARKAPPRARRPRKPKTDASE
ncbi:NYN domain-containing protein [Thauera sp.]|jgi:uncharacterized protein (TIGR00288 family)|uniref:NYN domain-containing protein n=1 Tax=Thauera sp. TaxID=1905334 RepID=UPI002A36F50E|nr:NYN domain-containing protein [Thauera sp.]MDX9884796.1 NYN domain-containing protein [Thauera sp.]